MQDGAAHLQHTLLFANNELLGVRTLVSARNLRIDAIHHLGDMPVTRLGVSH